MLTLGHSSMTDGSSRSGSKRSQSRPRASSGTCSSSCFSPDSFERIFGGGDRRLIVQNFTGLSRARVPRSPRFRSTASSRGSGQQSSRRLPDSPLDFYVNPLKEQWQAETPGPFDAIERDDVLAALREIDENGVRADAESTVYDLVHGTQRYPPKLVLSLASKHSGGEEFDRSLSRAALGPRHSRCYADSGFTSSARTFFRGC